MKKITSKKSKYSFSFYEKIKKKICTKIILILGGIMRKCGGQEMEYWIKKREDDIEKYQIIMQNKNKLENEIQKIMKMNNAQKTYKYQIENAIVEINMLISLKKYEEAQKYINELMEIFGINLQNEGQK